MRVVRVWKALSKDSKERGKEMWSAEVLMRPNVPSAGEMSSTSPKCGSDRSEMAAWPSVLAPAGPAASLFLFSFLMGVLDNRQGLVVSLISLMALAPQPPCCSSRRRAGGSSRGDLGRVADIGPTPPLLSRPVEEEAPAVADYGR